MLVCIHSSLVRALWKGSAKLKIITNNIFTGIALIISDID